VGPAVFFLRAAIAVFFFLRAAAAAIAVFFLRAAAAAIAVFFFLRAAAASTAALFFLGAAIITTAAEVMRGCAMETAGAAVGAKPLADLQKQARSQHRAQEQTHVARGCCSPRPAGTWVGAMVRGDWWRTRSRRREGGRTTSSEIQFIICGSRRAAENRTGGIHVVKSQQQLFFSGSYLPGVGLWCV
jgi:hypothetical protein